MKSSEVELEEHKLPKRIALSVGELAVGWVGQKKGRRVKLPKLLELLLVKDQKDLLVE